MKSWFGIIFVTILALAPSARAGDFAQTIMLGTSPDGRYIAVEEFGVQDGSGFPYSSIFVIDIDNDSWVKGTPVRVRIDNEMAAPSSARRQARQQVTGILDSLDISEDVLPVLLAANPRGELSSDPHYLIYNSSLAVPSQVISTQLELVETSFENNDCPDPAIKGFILTQTANGQSRQLHKDTKIPGSRKCPLRYRIRAVHSLLQFGGPRRFIVTIQMESFGFEGPDGRHLFIGFRR
jgi:predicted secreted protein